MLIKDFIEKHELTLTSTQRPPEAKEVKEYERDPLATHWTCVISKTGSRRTLTTQFHMGSLVSYSEGALKRLEQARRAHEHSNLPKPVKPTLEHVLDSLRLDASAINYTFLDWCGEYGGDTDSIKQLRMFEACVEGYRQLRGLLGPEGTEELFACDPE